MRDLFGVKQHLWNWSWKVLGRKSQVQLGAPPGFGEEVATLEGDSPSPAG